MADKTAKSATVVDLSAVKQGQGKKTQNKRAKCPICAKPSDPAYRPFCSKRCADVDLGKWLDGGYRIPTDEFPGQDGDFDVED